MPIQAGRGTKREDNGLIREYLQKGMEVPGDIDYL
jgi:IS30 family transposase